ncbi:MAG: KH domain-containing protein [Candidatus Levybacteria bacterium]|nr:KH domain-containing protein [Candidatus Levybacteria bacterium]
MAENKEIAKKLIGELFDSLGIKDSFDVNESEESIDIIISSEDPGLIIGHHGDTLDSIQLVLSLMLAKKLGEFKRVSVEVGDYKKNRSDYLKNLAAQTKDRALSEGQEIFLPNLKSWERREVHMYLSEDPDVISESVGEGKDRTLVVKPK